MALLAVGILVGASIFVSQHVQLEFPQPVEALAAEQAYVRPNGVHVDLVQVHSTLQIAGEQTTRNIAHFYDHAVLHRVQCQVRRH